MAQIFFKNFFENNVPKFQVSPLTSLILYMPVKPRDKKNREKTKKMVQNNFFGIIHHENNKHKIKSAGRSVTQK